MKLIYFRTFDGLLHLLHSKLNRFEEMSVSA